MLYWGLMGQTQPDSDLSSAQIPAIPDPLVPTGDCELDLTHMLQSGPILNVRGSRTGRVARRRTGCSTGRR